jgi:hypothetical protein
MQSPQAAWRRASRRSIQFARLERERMACLHTGRLTTTFLCAAPARGDALADERRIVAGDEDGPHKGRTATSTFKVRRDGSGGRASAVE